MPETDIYKPSMLKLCFRLINIDGYRLFALLFFFLIFKIYPQELVTDRPDQTESAVTVPLKSLQVETGFLYEGNKENGFAVDNYSLAGTLLRYGLFEKIELRFGTAYLISKTSGIYNNGIGDFLLGTKINFLTEEINSFDFSLLIHAALPLGDDNFNPQKTEPEIIAALSKSLSDKFSISINLGGYNDSSIEEIIYLYTTAVGYTFTDKLAAFIEVFGNFRSSFAPVNNYDGGITYFLSENVQLDLSGGSRFTGNNSYWFIGSGISFRIKDL